MGIIHKFGALAVETITKLHYWMMKNPQNTTPCEGINKIIIGIDGILITDLIMPNMLGGKLTTQPIISIIFLISNIVVWCIIGIFKVKIPIKYKLFFLFLTIPSLFLINKFLDWIKNIIKNNNYERKN